MIDAMSESLCNIRTCEPSFHVHAVVDSGIAQQGEGMPDESLPVSILHNVFHH